MKRWDCLSSEWYIEFEIAWKSCWELKNNISFCGHILLYAVLIPIIPKTKCSLFLQKFDNKCFCKSWKSASFNFRGMFKGVCVCVTQLTALEMVSDIPLLNSAPSPRVRIFMSLQTSIFDTWFRHPCSLLDGMMFLVIYIVTSFTFCILREWFPLFRQAGIPRVICLLSCCWNWGKKRKNKKSKCLS